MIFVSKLLKSGCQYSEKILKIWPTSTIILPWVVVASGVVGSGVVVVVDSVVVVGAKLELIFAQDQTDFFCW